MIPDNLPDSDYEDINNLDDVEPFDTQVYGVYIIESFERDEVYPPDIYKHSDAMMWKLRGYDVVHYPHIVTKNDTLVELKWWVATLLNKHTYLEASRGKR
jgi:hypothetical protein